MTGKEVVLNFGLLEGTEMLKKRSKQFVELRSSLSPFVTCIIPQSVIPLIHSMLLVLQNLSVQN